MEKTETNMIQRKTLIGALLAAGLVPLATAQKDANGQNPRAGQTGSQTAPGADATQPGRLALQRSDKVIGADVHDASGMKIGRIDDLIVEPDGRIGYAIISGTTPDTMAKEYPIPWSMVKAQMANDNSRTGQPAVGAEGMNMTDRYSLSIDSAKLATAPSFDRAQWPKAGDAGVYTESDRFFGSSAVANGRDNRQGRPVEAGMSSPTYYRVSQLRNQSVNDASGMPVGTLGQVVLDPTQGRVNYVTFSTSTTAGANARTVAMPWQTIKASRADDKDRFELTVPQDRLQGAPEFQNGEESWKRMSDPSYVHDVYSYYSVNPYWKDAGADRGRKPDTNGNDGGARNPNEPKKGNEPKQRGSGEGTGGQKGTDTTGGNRPPH
jgi:sporulation protein YlmC with PRC-barrel domain